MVTAVRTTENGILSIYRAQIGDIWGVGGMVLSLINSLKQKLGAIDVSEGVGTANTALVYHAKRIMALNEGDLPYQVGFTLLRCTV
jgi:hypothetical protein